MAMVCILMQQQSFAQHVDIKINADAVKKIKFDFTPPVVPISEYKKMQEAPIEKEFLDYRLDLHLPHVLHDSIRTKKYGGYIRLEPYTIWTAFGEDPIYDVLYAGTNKRWEIHWTINMSAIRKQYRRHSGPSAGMAYDIATGSAGVGFAIPVDFDKFFFETFTRRGRAIKHNRTHAIAWKTYSDYLPTEEDNRRFPNFIPPAEKSPRSYDTLSAEASSPDSVMMTKHRKKREGIIEKTRFRHTGKDNADDGDLSRLLEERRRLDSIQRHQLLHGQKLYDNPYEIQRQIRAIEERQR